MKRETIEEAVARLSKSTAPKMDLYDELCRVARSWSLPIREDFIVNREADEFDARDARGSGE